MSGTVDVHKCRQGLSSSGKAEQSPNSRGRRPGLDWTSGWAHSSRGQGAGCRISEAPRNELPPVVAKSEFSRPEPRQSSVLVHASSAIFLLISRIVQMLEGARRWRLVEADAGPDLPSTLLSQGVFRDGSVETRGVQGDQAKSSGEIWGKLEGRCRVPSVPITGNIPLIRQLTKFEHMLGRAVCCANR